MRMQWTQLSLTTVLSCRPSYYIPLHIQLCKMSIYSELLKLPFAKRIAHFSMPIVVLRKHTHTNNSLARTILCFVTSCSFFISKNERKKYHSNSVCLLFNLHTCIRYDDWFVMCIWFVSFRSVFFFYSVCLVFSSFFAVESLCVWLVCTYNNRIVSLFFPVKPFELKIEKSTLYYRIA